jgi:hypothetical protein
VLSLPFFILSQLSILVLIVLSVIARNWQPFKARGILLIWGLILHFLTNFGYLLSYIVSVENGYHYELLQFVILCFPIALLIRFLILIVSEMFSLILRITSKC